MGKYITEAYLVLRIKEGNMAAWMKMYLISTGIFLCIDAIWLGFIARGIYAKYLGYIMAKNIVWWAAGVFYLIFMAGLLFFVIEPSVRTQSIRYALAAGAFFGFVAYATYDLTNLATIEGWPLFVTVIDLIWGAFVASSTSVLSYMLINRFM
jgi:uncharacterized membrane protein